MFKTYLIVFYLVGGVWLPSWETKETRVPLELTATEQKTAEEVCEERKNLAEELPKALGFKIRAKALCLTVEFPKPEEVQ